MSKKVNNHVSKDPPIDRPIQGSLFSFALQFMIKITSFLLTSSQQQNADV